MWTGFGKNLRLLLKDLRVSAWVFLGLNRKRRGLFKGSIVLEGAELYSNRKRIPSIRLSEAH